MQRVVLQDLCSYKRLQHLIERDLLIVHRPLRVLRHADVVRLRLSADYGEVCARHTCLPLPRVRRNSAMTALPPIA